MKKYDYPVVFCIGTPKVSGDSLGPKVGDILKKNYSVPAYVYGTSCSPVTGVNYCDYVRHVKTFHPDSLVIAVDACLGGKNDVGKIKYTTRGLKAGSALKKELGRVGNIGFLGIVAESGKDNFYSLTVAEKQKIDQMAEVIAAKIYRLCTSMKLKNSV